MTTSEARESLLPATARALLHRVAVAQAEGRAPSFVGGLVREGALVWSAGRSADENGVPDADTQYRIGSLTKMFTAVLVLRLREEGLLDLADPVAAHLPEAAPAGSATVAQLLAHTSGLAAETGGPWWERTPGEVRPRLADVFGEEPLLHPAGRTHHYSNPGYAVLGALVAQVRGTTWERALRREILDPLGMERTTTAPRPPHAEGWAVHPFADVMQPEPAVDTGLMAPAGQLWSTAADLARFAGFLLHGDPRILPVETLREMRAPASGPNDPGWSAGYGLGFGLLRTGDRVLFGHGGSMPGFLASLWVSEEDALAGIALANATSGPATGDVACDLVRLTREHEPRIPAPWRPASEADPELLALTGTWYWGTRAHTLRVTSGRNLSLAALDGGGRASRFRPEPDGTWRGLDGYYAGERLRPVTAAEGTHLDLGSFVFTRAPYEPSGVLPGGADPRGWNGA
ncbi:serine hydrolase domain-containing protein [Streptomyces xiaopingdaonensis]|uniref:serine hydrolase domain-containing protein n=1 Tax=Streptomyces xiaopingdaonensis TaxID=1565415 RepID=UPI0002EF9007|nr:serine hydrolase domain-containing protein [Streptomyces xiaopingdaonensis]